MAPKSESEVAVTAPANDKKEKEKTGGKNLLIKQLTQTLLVLNLKKTQQTVESTSLK